MPTNSGEFVERWHGKRRGGHPQTHGKKQVFTKEQMERLITACGRRTYGQFRNRTLIVVYWRAGLRCEEALSLFPHDIDLHRGTIRVVGKGRRSRTVGLDQRACRIVAEFLEQRKAAGFTDEQPLFCTRFGTRMHINEPCRMVKVVAKRAGIAERVHPHAFRHTMSCDMAYEGFTIFQIQAQLGHAKLAMTERYLAGLMPAELIKGMSKREW